MKIIPNYHPPSDYRRPTKTQEKVYVPVNDYPEINFSMITNPLTPLSLIVSFPSFVRQAYSLLGLLRFITLPPLTNLITFTAFTYIMRLKD
jgi:hypothetical protein